jgi:hypothetical protein
MHRTRPTRAAAASPVLRRAGCAGLLATALALVGYGNYYVISEELGYRRTMACHAHMGALLSAMEAYLAEHGNLFPEGKGWCDLLLPYLGDRSAFVCPAARNHECSYAYNSALARVAVDDLTDPRLTVVIFESDAGWNASGGPELLPTSPRHGRGGGSDVVGFADWMSHVTPRARPILPGDRWPRAYVEPLQWQPRLREAGLTSGAR